MESVVDLAFALGVGAAFGFVAFGAWLVFRHASERVAEPRGQTHAPFDDGKLV